MRIGVLLLAAAGLLACAAGSRPAQAADPSPCSLIEPAEMEAVTGPLAGPPFRASGTFPDAEGDTCRYETPDLRAVSVRVEWRDGGETFAIMNMTQGVITEGGLKGVVKLSDGTELVGEWDEARVFMCCEFNALRGEQLVVVDISGARATIEQAAGLADAALLRIDAPLDLDDAPGVAAAMARDELRPKPRPACELLTRAEAEAITGAPLQADPEGNENECTYAWVAPDAGYELEFTMSVTWRGGFSELHMTQAAMGQALAFLESQGLKTEQEQGAGAALDEVVVNMLGVMGVRKDVMLSVETGGAMNDVARAFIETAASKL